MWAGGGRDLLPASRYLLPASRFLLPATLCFEEVLWHQYE